MRPRPVRTESAPVCQGSLDGTTSAPELRRQTNLQMFEKKSGGLHVQDLREEVVTDWSGPRV